MNIMANKEVFVVPTVKITINNGHKFEKDGSIAWKGDTSDDNTPLLSIVGESKFFDKEAATARFNEILVELEKPLWSTPKGNYGIAGQDAFSVDYNYEFVKRVICPQVVAAGMKGCIERNGRKIQAKFDSFCSLTGKRVLAGEEVIYYKGIEGTFVIKL